MRGGWRHTRLLPGLTLRLTRGLGPGYQTGLRLTHSDYAAKSAAARLLEIATRNADELLGEARAEAASIVATARTDADRLTESSQAQAEQLTASASVEADRVLAAAHAEAERVHAELDQTRAEQNAELDGHRTTVLADLAERQAALEAELARLQQLEQEHRNRMRKLPDPAARADRTESPPWGSAHAERGPVRVTGRAVGLQASEARVGHRRRRNDAPRRGHHPHAVDPLSQAGRRLRPVGRCRRRSAPESCRPRR